MSTNTSWLLLAAAWILISSQPFATAMAKSVEIKCRFEDEGRMPPDVRLKLDVFEGIKRVGFGNDANQHKFIKCTAAPTDVATRLILKFGTTKMDEWVVDPPESEIGVDEPISVSLLVIHRASVLNADLDTAESVTRGSLPEAKQALEKAKPLVRVSGEKVRWARAQDKIFELEDVDSASRQAAFALALEGVNRALLTRAERLALVQQEFDLLKDTVADTSNLSTIAQVIKADGPPLASGKTPKEEFTAIANHAEKATANRSLKDVAAKIDRGSTKAVNDVAKSLHRSIRF